MAWNDRSKRTEVWQHSRLQLTSRKPGRLYTKSTWAPTSYP